MNKRIENNNRTMTKQAPSLRAKIAQRVACLACGPARREGWPDGDEAVKEATVLPGQPTRLSRIPVYCP